MGEKLTLNKYLVDSMEQGNFQSEQRRRDRVESVAKVAFNVKPDTVTIAAAFGGRQRLPAIVPSTHGGTATPNRVSAYTCTSASSISEVDDDSDDSDDSGNGIVPLAPLSGGPRVSASSAAPMVTASGVTVVPLRPMHHAAFAAGRQSLSFSGMEMVKVVSEAGGGGGGGGGGNGPAQGTSTVTPYRHLASFVRTVMTELSEKAKAVGSRALREGSQFHGREVPSCSTF